MIKPEYFKTFLHACKLESRNRHYTSDTDPEKIQEMIIELAMQDYDNFQENSNQPVVDLRSLFKFVRQNIITDEIVSLGITAQYKIDGYFSEKGMNVSLETVKYVARLAKQRNGREWVKQSLNNLSC